MVMLACISGSEAYADYSFSFISNDGTYGVQGALITPSNGNGPLTVSGGFVTGDGTLNNGVSYSLLPAGDIHAVGGDVLTSDNVLTPGSNIVLDGDGLVFKSNNNPVWINIWGNQSDYTYFQSGPTSWYANVNGTANVTPTPIPAAALLFGSGLMGLMGIRRQMKN